MGSLRIKRMSPLYAQMGVLSHTKGVPGEIAVEISRYPNRVYVYTGDKWVDITHDMDTSTVPQMQSMYAMVCTQCGALLHGNKCEYCDTEYR